MTQIRKLGGRMNALFLALFVAIVGSPVLAQATPQYDASSLVAQLEVDMTNAATTIFPALVVGIGLIVGWKYIRRFGKSV